MFMFMPRRTTAQSVSDDLAFPVRVKLAVPPRGLGRLLDDILNWLVREIGFGEFAHHSGQTIGGSSKDIYFRDAVSAQLFLEAFPAVALADGTQSPAYYRPGFGDPMEVFSVCNLYSMTTSQSAIRELFDGLDDRTGNLQALPAIFPDNMAPVVLQEHGAPVLKMMRWGMPSPAFALKGKKVDRGITNVRNTKSPHWRSWLGNKDCRCVVPFTSFSEPHNRAGHPSEPVWFALNEDRPLAFFAGIWTNWTSVRRLSEGETTNDLFAFLTTDANAVVGAIHPKTMPVILTQQSEIDLWLNAPVTDALALQRPAGDDLVQVVARGEKKVHHCH